METDRKKLRALVVDDDANSGGFVAQVLKDDGHAVTYASTFREASRLLAEKSWDIVISDLMLDENTGIDLLREVRARANPVPFVLMTGQAEVETTVEALREGAFDYLAKPVAIDQLRSVVTRIFQGEPEKVYEPPPSAEIAELPGKIAGRSRCMVRVFNEIGRAAMSASPVMILGELGVGKELIARAIHKHSPREQMPFIVWNCAAMSEVEFEHALGELAAAAAPAGCTLFLKQVNELSHTAQAKLVRHLEDASKGTPHPPVRYIASVIGGPESAQAMRKELYYALAVIQIAVPPLRERLDDLPLLMEHLMARIEGRVRKKLTLHFSAIKLLREHAWPGNIRELAYALEKAAVSSPRGELRDEDFRNLLVARTSPANLMRTISEIEREHILSVFGQCGGDVKRAAQILAVDSAELRKRLDSFATSEVSTGEASAVCAACGTIYTAEESRQLKFKCPRCVGIEGAMLVSSQADTPGLPADVPKFKSNRYVLYKLLGRSEFSEVWAGWQPSLCRRVVIKFLIAQEQKLLERFKREARIQATLRYPRIPSVYEAGYDELNPSKMFLAIEFIEGLPLDQYNMSIRDKVKEPERLRRNLVLGRQVALALHYLHGKDLVHRDIKPQNIIATKEQNAFLIDYGITRSVNTTESITMEGFILGTVPFMSPEQVAGRMDTLDGRTDIWSLGATLYYVMTGRLPFPGAKYDDVISKIQYEVPESPCALNPVLSKSAEELLLRSLEKSPDDRFRNADEMAKALEAEILKM